MAGRKRGKKAIVGIEAAIVLIAFVIVAAALAFVVLNMGMFTTQKSKEVMNQALNEASSALEVDGSVMAYVSNDGVIKIYIPLKVSPGQQAVDLSPGKIDVVIRIPKAAYSKIVTGVDTPPATGGNAVDLSQLGSGNAQTVEATFYMIQTSQNKGEAGFEVLEVGEKALLVISLPSGSALRQYDSFTVEIRPLAGAPLTVERTIPPTIQAGEFVNLV